MIPHSAFFRAMDRQEIYEEKFDYKDNAEERKNKAGTTKINYASKSNNKRLLDGPLTKQVMPEHLIECWVKFKGQFQSLSEGSIRSNLHFHVALVLYWLGENHLEMVPRPALAVLRGRKDYIC
ncbi:hypothetical protein C5167_014504 [Papaver somniferum]|uniref:Uncharacterized protein n=1 Tax=Papaver somniferum TaxID=3469 RepID=A0A4Y7J6H3_PAPSO|nr:hypothetical protein C5167_014504 [Papaver somniferum]